MPRAPAVAVSLLLVVSTVQVETLPLYPSVSVYSAELSTLKVSCQGSCWLAMPGRGPPLVWLISEKFTPSVETSTPCVVALLGKVAFQLTSDEPMRPIVARDIDGSGYCVTRKVS